jgi:hypothetical protein
MPLLAPDLRAWFEAHQTEPRQIDVLADGSAKHARSVWLVTDHTGTDDSSYRVTYEPSGDVFGLVTA